MLMGMQDRPVIVLHRFRPSCVLTAISLCPKYSSKALSGMISPYT
jgi:hypothetical protein